MTTKELLDTYYKGFAKKQGWEVTIADDFKFIGGDMTKTDPIVGKQAYLEIIKRFSALFTDMRPKEIFTSEEGAFVLANYDYVFPNGKSINANVAELWSVKNGKLDALTIFFDTEGFQKFLKG
ncbi:nuclear transport factor 2 family protein [Chryseolinea soli]|uniref:Nuclear transport factor 2 family protein n=1 Tax=Chryseolinea soli TaxID=2321403 RepID=A0A385SRN7_9BACT|nr:nuclear transport factor 2 family protein [Chryseolinea soli]AYB31518.1 nuclear transport factor 2 family protein [Chryseolinea soli]